MSSQAKVSIFIPSYNHARFLPQALESALAQTYRNIEIIVVDDGSEDDSLQIAETYARQHPSLIRVFTHAGNHNLGAAASANLAIQKSTGDFWSPLCSDDIFYPQKTEQQIAYMRDHPQVGWVHSYALYIDERGNLLPGLFGGDISREMDPLERLILGNSIPAITVFAKRECFEKIGKESEDLLYSDWELWARMVAHFKVGFIAEPLAKYRIHSANASVGVEATENARRGLAVLDSLKQNARRYGGDLDKPRAQILIDLERTRHLFCLDRRAEASAGLRSAFEKYSSAPQRLQLLDNWCGWSCPHPQHHEEFNHWVIGELHAIPERAVSATVAGRSRVDQKTRAPENNGLSPQFFAMLTEWLEIRRKNDNEIKELKREVQARDEMVERLSSQVAESSGAIETLSSQLAEREQEAATLTATLNSRLSAQESELATVLTRLSNTETQLNAILNSRAWRWVCRYGRVKMRYVAPALEFLRRRRTVEEKTAGGSFQVPRPIDSYDAWLEVNHWNKRRADLLRERLSKVTAPPLLSIVMPVYKPPLEFLDKAIQSIVDQVYENWELCIADDADTDPAIKSALERWQKVEPRIRVVFREENGNISRATNSAAESARGEYLIFVDQDDELTPDALGEVALHLAAHRDTDVLYSDDDKIDARGRRYAPQFKPDWSPELLLSYSYFSHLLVVRRDLFRDVGGMRVGFEGSQDYELALRVSEKANRIGHIPKILYHWRALPNSTASSGGAKPESFAAAKKGIEEAFERRGIRASVFQPEWARKANCGIFSHRFSDEGPRVAIIIPTKNNLGILKTCLNSIKKTTYKNYEVVIVDNESDDPATLDYLRKTPHRVLRIANPDGGFSFAAINNRAVEQVEAEYVLFLNNDTEVVSPNWLTQMVGYLNMPGVGAVGGRLLFPDGRIQHAGVVHGFYEGMAGPAFKLLPSHTNGYLSYARVTRNYSAVTAACMLTSRSLFQKLRGFDEENFAVAYNDVDFCYRLIDAGHRVVYCPSAELIHHEGYSRGFVDNPTEPNAFSRKYSGKVDPFFNPNLSLENERFAINARTVAPGNVRAIRSLMCAFNLNWEGAPQSQYEMTISLKEKGIIDPVVCCPVDGPLRREYERHGIPVRVIEHPLAGIFTLSDYYERIAVLARQIKEWGVELVYGNTLQTFYAIEAAHQLDCPSIWNPRESEPWQTYFDFLSPEIARQAYQCFSYPYRVVFVSNATRQLWEHFNSRHNFSVIHNGLNRERFAAELCKWPRDTARQHLGISESELAFLLPGTVCERKGQIDLIEALRQLGEEHTQRIRCLIVGDRPSAYRERLQEALNSLSPSRRAKLTMITETGDIALYYAAADVFVCCSRIESFPRVILEAMAAGLPIITTPVFGIAEQVKENVSALFYPPGETEALANAIRRLMDDPALREKLAANASRALDALEDFNSMTLGYAEVFREAWLSGGTRAWNGPR